MTLLSFKIPKDYRGNNKVRSTQPDRFDEVTAHGERKHVLKSNSRNVSVASDGQIAQTIVVTASRFIDQALVVSSNAGNIVVTEAGYGDAN